MRFVSLSLLLALTAGCGQEYIADGPSGFPGVEDPGGVFDSNDDDTVYRTASYETLRWTLMNSLGLQATVAPNAASLCGGAVLASSCPRANPVGYLDANRASLGTPVYEQEDPLATQPPGPMTSGGYKVWVLSASAACGRMMMEQAEPALFPGADVTNYTKLYQVLLGRLPTGGEKEILDDLRAEYTSITARPAPSSQGTVLGPTPNSTQVQGAAICTAVLGSLEFLMVN